MQNNITIILNRPQMGENIGAAARAMDNFGLSNLIVVNPRDSWPNEKALAVSAAAKDIIESAQVFETLEEAVADIEFIYAVSARIRDMNKPQISSREIELPAQKIGFLFGQENNGLSNDELDFANKILTIPTEEKNPSLNLAQAVCVLCYELSSIKEITPSSYSLATGEELGGLFEHLESLLDKKEFFKTLDKRPTMVQNLRGIFKRIENLTSQDVRSLRGVIRALAEERVK